MRDECYQAKLWLNRNYYSSRQLDADRRRLSIIENKLGSGVAKYENDGTGFGDGDAARARHEDTLLDYSEQKARVEREERELKEETAKTRSAIDKLDDDDCKAVAIDRYINCLKWNEIGMGIPDSRMYPHYLQPTSLSSTFTTLKTPNALLQNTQIIYSHSGIVERACS